MPRSIVKLIVLAVLTAGAWVGLIYYEEHHSPEAIRAAMRQQLEHEQKSGEPLKRIARHLHGGPRIADILVTDLLASESGPRTALLFQEYDPAGNALPARRLTFAGDTATIEAAALTISGELARGREAIAGKPVALFTRIRSGGDSTGPGEPIDPPGHVPATYRGGEIVPAEPEEKLWQQIWNVVNDPAYRQQAGVAVAGPNRITHTFERGRLYSITLHPDGRLAIRGEPLRRES